MTLWTAARALFRRPLTRDTRRPRHGSRLFADPLEDRCVPAVYTVNTLADVAPGAYDPNDGVVTLREAVERANQHPGADVIRFAPGLTGTIALTHGQLDVSDDLTVRGPGAGRLAVSGAGLSRVLFIDPGVTADVSDLTIRDGQAVKFGGGICNDGDLTLTRCAVVGNTATNDGATTTFGGGGIENQGTLTLWGSRVAGNTLVGTQTFQQEIDNGGGGINSVSGRLNIFDSVITGNHSFNGGGLRSSRGTFTMVGSVVSGNTATGIVGGGLELVSSVSHISDSTISDNHIVGSFGNGGAFSNDGSQTVLDRCVITGNSATAFGGVSSVAALEEGGPASVVTVRDSLVLGNTALKGGAFAVIDGSTLAVDRTVLANNRATADGGAIWVGNFLGTFGNSSVAVTDSVLIGNSAVGNGGAVFVQVADKLVIDHSLVAFNSAGGDGGGLYLKAAPAVFDLSTAVIVFNTPDNVVVAG